MKKIFSLAILLLTAIFAGFAQGMPELPTDPDVRIGKLPNGLTYYIRHNDKVKGQADFYIAQRVGSVVEDDSQRGLAHFLEHMCFNGTESFPGNGLISWLENQGVKFGYNLNAYTGVDQTVYYMSDVPVARTAVQDTCLVILHDWADGLLLDPEEIDKERGVIHEEWRRSMAGQMRILENLLPVIYPNEVYGHRLPIGTMEVVDNFKPETLRAYYEKWYRPDLQAVLVVGDIDPDYIESKIKEIFSPIKMPENPAKRVYFPVADNEGTIYAIGKDKEQKNSLISLMIKHDVLPDSLKNTPIFLVQDYAESMIRRMLNARLAEKAKLPETPFAQASVSIGDFFLSRTKGSLDLQVISKTNDLVPAFEDAYRELLRAARGGFTVGEYERAKKEYLSKLETQYKNRNDRRNDQLVNELVNNFLEAEPIPGIEYEYNLINMIVPSLPVEQINAMFAQYVTPDNRVIMAMTPDNDQIVFPTEEAIAAAIAKVDAETLEPYVDETKSEPLIPSALTPGKIVSKTHDERFDATLYTLSNGVKVMLKPTKFKEDEILFDATAVGGYADVDPAKAAEIIFMPYVFQQTGLGTYSRTDLKKYLAGKQAGVQLNFSDDVRNVSGACAPRDLATLMELIYMNFTDVTISEDDYAALQKTYAGVLHNQESDPQYIFIKDVLESSIKSPLKRQLSTEYVNSARRDVILDLAKAFTANATDYAFTFVGNIDPETFEPLAELYLANLPVNAEASVSFSDVADLQMVKGNTKSEFKTAMETPQTWTAIMMFGNVPYTAKNVQLASIAADILGNRLLKRVREEMGATYSIGAYDDMSRLGEQNVVFQSMFPMKPEMRDEVLAYIADETKNMTSTVTAEELSKQTEYLLKEATASREKNGSWLKAISGYSLNSVDTFNGIDDVIKSITVDDVQNFMKQLLEQGNYRQVTLDPEAK